MISIESNLAPIALFTYKRLDTLKSTVESLKKNSLALNSILYIFSDSAKSSSDIEQVRLVREYLRTIQGFKEIHIEEAGQNKGLATSIISGVNNILKVHDKIIVLEDDLLLATNFLDFMNQSLSQYKNSKDVFSISGFSFDFTVPADYYFDGYFLTRGWSWGWATWKDRWEPIDWQIKDYPEFSNNKQLKKEFSKGGSDLNSMLKKQIEGKLDSWAIRWFYSQFRKGGLTYYPVISKVSNEGFDRNATHTKSFQSRFQTRLDRNNKTKFTHLEKIEKSNFFQSQLQNKMGLISRSISKIETSINYLFNR